MTDQPMRIAGRLADLAERGAAAPLTRDQPERRIEHPVMRKFAAFALCTARLRSCLSLQIHLQDSFP
jgi:hypothetical protein